MLQAGVKVWPAQRSAHQELHAAACSRHSTSRRPHQACSRDQLQQRWWQESSVCCSAASVAAGGLRSPADDSFLHPYQHQQQQQPTARAGAVRRQLLAQLRKAASHSRLLELLQDCSREQITPDLIKAVLFQASRVARSTVTATSNSNSSSSEGLAAQQLVCACLQLLLQLNEQISGWHLSNCLLSLGVLCGRGGPASPVMAGAVDSSSTLPDASILQQQQSQQSTSAGVLQHLLNPARSSRRDLEALLQATGPQHQLQQLLHATRHTAVAAAQPQQLVDMLYGLAVLPLRPAPDVLSLMLQSLQDQLQRMHTGSSSSSSNDGVVWSAGAGAAAGDAPLSPKQLSQLLWSAATLQLHLPDSWLHSHWAASITVLPLYSAQDVANTCWALASLKQQEQQATAAADDTDAAGYSPLQLPPAWQAALFQQATAVAGALTAQGVSNTLWGLAVLQAPTEPQLLLALLQRAVQLGSRFKPQELANTVWGAARCLQLADQQQVSVPDRTSAATAAAATTAAAGLQECRQQLQQLLQQHGPELSHELQPRDWSNIIWGAGLAGGVQPGKTLLQALWRKTPARFSTSLNPHAPLGSSGTVSSSSSSRRSSSDSGSSTAAVAASAASLQAVLSNPTLWSPQALANTLWGCARLRVLPPRVWLQGFEAASVAVLAGFSHQQLANTLWAFGEMRHPPSEAWLQLFWQQAADMPRQLSAAAAAAGAGVHSVLPKQQQLLLAQQQQQHVGQVLQACGRLRLEPPVGWLQEAAAGLIAAADVQLAGNTAHHQQQQQQQQQTDIGAHLHSCAAVVFALAELARAVTIKQQRLSSSRTVAAVAIAAGRQLLQLLTAPTGDQQHQHEQQQGPLCPQLKASDTLALLLALPQLQLPPAQARAVGAALLLRAQQQQQQLSASQAAQFAYAAACLVHGSNRGSSSGSSRSAACGVWQQLHEQSQAAGAPISSSSSSRSDAVAAATAYVDQLAVLLTQYSSSMSAVDLRFSLAAVAKLHTSLQLLSAHTSSSRTGKGRAQQLRTAAGPSAAVAAFTAAAGAAVGHKLGGLTPHQRSVVAASLAALGFSPQSQWVDMLLHYSGCDLSGCSNGDLVRLVQALPLLLSRTHRTQQQQLVQVRTSATSSSGGGRGVQSAAGSVRFSSSRQVQAGCVSVHQQQAVQEWWSDWLSETEGRLDAFSTAQVVGMAQGVARLAAFLERDASSSPAAAAAVRSGSNGSSSSSLAARLQATRVSLQQQRQHQQQQQLAVLGLPDSWQDTLLQVLAGRLHCIGAPELLLVLSTVRRLGVAPGQDWCAAVAAEAAARAAAAVAATGVEAAGRSAAAAATGAAAGSLKVHHVGWLALYLQRLGYVPPAEQQAALLRHVATACEVRAAAGAVVGGRQLWQLLMLLPEAGWSVEAGWVEGVQGSTAGQRLRAWLGQRQCGSTWQQLWARLLS